jgi:hypothetical protein
MAAAASAQPAGTPDLEGLWVAHARYGPDVRGRTDDLPARKRPRGRHGGLLGAGEAARPEAQLRPSDGKGSFRGERSGDQIEGQWIQSVTVEGGARYATPLVLLADVTGAGPATSCRARTV